MLVGKKREWLWGLVEECVPTSAVAVEAEGAAGGAPIIIGGGSSSSSRGGGGRSEGGIVLVLIPNESGIQVIKDNPCWFFFLFHVGKKENGFGGLVEECVPISAVAVEAEGAAGGAPIIIGGGSSSSSRGGGGRSEGTGR